MSSSLQNGLTVMDVAIAHDQLAVCEELQHYYTLGSPQADIQPLTPSEGKEEPVELKAEDHLTTPDTPSEAKEEPVEPKTETQSDGEQQAPKPELEGRSNAIRRQQDKVSLFCCDMLTVLL